MGLGFLFLLLGTLAAILPSRVTLLRGAYELWIPPAPTAAPPPTPPVGPFTLEATQPAAEPRPRAFTVDFGPFITASEAEEVETRLNGLGVSTIRYRTRSGSALYAVEIGDFPTPTEARETMEQLRRRHPTLPLGRLPREAEERVTIVVGPLYPLREAVALAGQLRTDGFATRIKTARAGAPLFRVRLATAYDLKTARERSQELRERGFPNAVVPAERASSP